MRTARRPARRGRSGWGGRFATLLVALAGGQLLVACGGGGSSSGTPTLNLYIYPDNSGAVEQAVSTCTEASGGKYRIKYQRLPTGADGQRQQMVRRLAAKDSAMD